MLDVKALFTKLLNKLPRVHEEVKNCTFVSGKSYVDITYTLPAGAKVLMGVLNGRPNPDWIYADISAIGTTSCRIAYNNTYSSSLSGNVTLRILYTL